MAGKAFSLRLTPRDGSDDEVKFKRALEKLQGSYLAVREYANSMHLHVLAWTEFDMKKVRNTVTNTMGKTGNGVISMKACHDPPGWLQYICKGDRSHPEKRGDPPEVAFREGMWTTDECIKTAYDAYWAQSQKCKETKGVSFTNKVMFYMATNQIEFTMQKTVKAVVEFTMAEKQQLNDYYIIGVAKMIMAKNNLQFKQEYIQSLLARIDASSSYPADSCVAEPSERCGCSSCDSLGEGCGTCRTQPSPVSTSGRSPPECVSDWQELPQPPKAEAAGQEGCPNHEVRGQFGIPAGLPGEVPDRSRSLPNRCDEQGCCGCS